MANLALVGARVADVSHHQTIDVGRLPLDGIIGRTAQAKGGQYGTTVDRKYLTHKANATRGGKLWTSYFYLGSGLTPLQNAQLHASCEPDRGVGVMLDWENGSGNGAFLLDSLTAFRDLGYHVWGTYAPRWYWSAQGSPDLRACPPLVSSRYKDNLPGTFEAEYSGTPEEYWIGYGNNTVRLLQFTSVGRIDPYPSVSLDLNAFKGSRADLAAWWSPLSPNPDPNPSDLNRSEELMERRTVTPPNANENTERVWLSGGPDAALIVRPRIGGDGLAKPMWVGHIYAWASDKNGVGHDPVNTPGYNSKLTSHRRFDLPGAVWADFVYSAADPFEIDLVG